MRSLPALAILALSGCSTAVADQPKVKFGPQHQSLAQSGIVVAWMDKSANPCSDFFQYACGGFTKSADIPNDREEWGAIEMADKDAEDFLHGVLEDAARNASADAGTAKLGTFYASCMDERAVDRVGTTPIQPLLDTIAKVDGPATADDAIIALAVDGISTFFEIGQQQDLADATKVIAALDQSGLGLPDRKYYLDSTGTLAQTRAAYQAHVERMFTLAGRDAKAAKTAAANAFRIETAIAKLHMDDVTRRDPHATYHRVERAGLDKTAKGFPWGAYLTALGIPDVTAITVHDPAYYPAIIKLIASEKPAALRDYLTWHVLDDSASQLGHVWVDEAFAMRQLLTGQKELEPRWRRCLHATNHALGQLLAQSYVKAKFGGDARARAIDLTKNILGAMRVELDGLAWMDDATRVEAKKKLDKMGYLVGYPDTWRAYDFEVSRGDFATNVRAAKRFEQRRELAKIGKPVDRYDWLMTPQTVNAYYDPSLNELVLPAAQLQPPFFGASFHPAVNFSEAGGGTIGHEMTHGFDDEGAQYDADGNLRDWWTKDTKAKFADATRCVVDQYSQYEAVPGVKLDGKLTAGENIADIGGVKLGYAAYEIYKATQAKAKHPVQANVDGFTDDQLYFIGYAQSWCEKTRPELLETMAHSNPHSPPMWRVDGVIVNQPAFGGAFSCAAGTPMNPATKCAVW
jgi:predicted metalloendopeptidase|nr:M13 family metallopeptidase [Kofleriaceae bacterium]